MTGVVVVLIVTVAVVEAVVMIAVETCSAIPLSTSRGLSFVWSVSGHLCGPVGKFQFQFQLKMAS